MLVVFGSINLDVIFRLDDLPRAGETVLARAFRSEPGGKGANQAVAAALDGADVGFHGAVGRDSLAGAALSGLEAAGVDLRGVVTSAESTGVASIMTDAAGRNSIAVAAGANLRALQAGIPDDSILDASAVLVQMECAVDETIALISRASDLGAKVILNLAPATDLPEDILRKLHLLVVNEPEAEFVAGRLGVAANAEALAGRLAIGVVRTLGEVGSEAFFEGRRIAVPAQKIEARDTTAAGDCFVGVMAAALDRGADLEGAMRRAAVAAALACTRAGSQTSLPKAAEIDAAISAARG